MPSLFRDSSSSREEALDESVRQQRNARIHQALASHDRAFGQDGRLRTEYLETLVDHGLDEETTHLLRNLISQDYVLANYKRAEVREAGWLARVEFKKVKCLHPGEGAILQGELRQFMFDDPTQGLTSLSPTEKTLLHQALLDIYARITRGDDMAQQDQFAKSINENIIHDESRHDDKSGGLFQS